MRDILFRGKRLDNGEWIYGLLTIEHFVNMGVDIEKAYCIKEIPKAPGVSYLWVKVNPETIGQYTGLTDKNGKRIFEGDVVKYGDTIHTTVFEQRNGTAYFGLVYSAFETLPFGHYQDLKQIEIIGNIHDNPEFITK